MPSNITPASTKPKTRQSYLAKIILLLVPSILVLIIDADSILFISLAHWDIKVRLWLALAVLLIVLPVVIASVRGLLLLLSGRWLSRRLHDRNQQMLQAGLHSYLEGDWYDCVSQLKPLNRKQYSMVALIIGARAAHRLGNDNLVKQWLNDAESIANSGDIAPRLEQLAILIDNEEYQLACDFIDALPLDEHKRFEIIRYKRTVYQALDMQEALSDLEKTYGRQLKKILRKKV